MLLFILNLLSCNDYTMAGKALEQDILAFPSHIDFGHLTSGEETGLEEFAVINSGQVDLTITTPTLVSGNNRFSLGGLAEQEWIIGPQEHLTFEVSYIPETFELNEAHIEVASDAVEHPVVIVTLAGNGDAPVMTISPLEFDYGDIDIGCDNEERITITNDGNLPLVIDDIVQMVTQPVDIFMEFGSLPAPPWIIEPGLSLDFLVSYIPSDVGSDESLIEIVGNDPVAPEIETIQFGDGDVEQWVTETHLQEERAILDILWVVDDSGSMNRFQTSLSANIGLFVQAFVSTGADYRMAVITTTHSMIGNIIDSSTQNPEAAIAAEVVVGVGGAGWELGLEKSRDALSNPASAGVGGAFLRADADLIVIYVSDEPDYGAGWTSYIHFFDGIKPLGHFTPYAVIGDPPSGCSASVHVNAMYGEGYWDLVNYYGGNWYSICATDWGVQLEMMANQMAGRNAYELGEENPIDSTISVTVNGQTMTDWEYEPSTNSIRFADGKAPDPGQTIEIEYALWGC